jgi:hypothetical protein
MRATRITRCLAITVHISIILAGGMKWTIKILRCEKLYCGICCGRGGTGPDFLRVLQFPLIIDCTNCSTHTTIITTRGWYNRPTTKWTRYHHTPWIKTDTLHSYRCENPKSNKRYSLTSWSTKLFKYLKSLFLFHRNTHRVSTTKVSCLFC